MRRPAAHVLVPAALTGALCFDAGGFFADTTGVAAASLLVLLAVRSVVVERPFAGVGRRAAFACGALALLGAWMLASAVWSDAPGRAVVEADRVLLYLLVLVWCAAVPRHPGDLAALVRALALVMAGVCCAALATRLAPDLLPTSRNVLGDRLSFPLTYWNALAMLAAIALVLCAHLCSQRTERPAVAALAAAAVPPVACALVLTFSRGGLVAAALGLVLLAALVRPARLATAALAVGPPTAVALAATLFAGELASLDATTEAAAAQGHRVAAVVVLCALVAGLMGLRFARRPPPLPSVRVPRRVALGAMLTAALLATPVAVERIDAFFGAPAPNDAAGDLRARLAGGSGSGRGEYWQAAFDAFGSAPAHGTGAGMYERAWQRNRPRPAQALHAHSLPVETLAELGIVGLLLLAAAIGAPLAALARGRGRPGPDGAAAGALLAAGIAWLAHASVEWHWQMPAITVWLFAAGGIALAAEARPDRRAMPVAARFAIAVVLLAAAAAPAAVAIADRAIVRAIGHWESGECDRARDFADLADAALPLHPEPPAVTGLCTGSERDLRRAIERDPSEWLYRYDLALVRAAAGRDPRPELVAALERNPREPAVTLAVTRFSAGDWRTRADGALVLIRDRDAPLRP